MKRNPPDYYDDLLLNMGEMGKRSVTNPRERKWKSQLLQLAGPTKRRSLSKNKLKQRKLAEKYYSSIFQIRMLNLAFIMMIDSIAEKVCFHSIYIVILSFLISVQGFLNLYFFINLIIEIIMVIECQAEHKKLVTVLSIHGVFGHNLCP